MNRWMMSILRGKSRIREPDQVADSSPVVVIEPDLGWRPIDMREIWKYRELFYLLVWREIKGRYAQSVLGLGWAVIPPIMQMIVFTVIFGRLLNVDSDGTPYAVFSYTAVVPWTFFSGGLIGSAGSLVSFKAMLTRVYFPRLIMPLAAVLSKLVDFLIAFSLVFALIAWFRIAPTIWVLTLPLLTLLMLLAATGIGMWLTALAIQYRDLRFGLSFVVQLLMWGSPVVYPASMVPDQYRLIYALNPMVGIIEGFRSALLGTNPMPWDLLAVASLVTILSIVTGAFYFRRMERIFADVA